MSEFPSPLYTKSKTPAVGDHLYDILGNDTGLTVGTLSGTTGFYVNRSITPATYNVTYDSTKWNATTDSHAEGYGLLVSAKAGTENINLATNFTIS